MSIFEEINAEEEKKEVEKQDAIAELPEAYQVLTTEQTRGLNGKTQIREVIIDTFMVDKARGIVPSEKAKIKARKMKEVYPDKSFYVVEVVHRIIANY
jgi:hypothetical protein